jgi:hypothetical protein
MDDKKTNDGVRYERQDIRLRWLLVLLAGSCCLTVIVFYAAWRYFWWQEGVQEETKTATSPLSPGLTPRLPPEPRLEQIDRMANKANPDALKSLEAKEKALNSFGPTEEKGFVHIPIQQAIKAVAGKLPVRKEPPTSTAADNGLFEGGESNSGRMLRGPSP